MDVMLTLDQHMNQIKEDAQAICHPQFASQEDDQQHSTTSKAIEAVKEGMHAWADGDVPEADEHLPAEERAVHRFSPVSHEHETGMSIHVCKSRAYGFDIRMYDCMYICSMVRGRLQRNHPVCIRHTTRTPEVHTQIQMQTVTNQADNGSCNEWLPLAVRLAPGTTTLSSRREGSDREKVLAFRRPETLRLCCLWGVLLVAVIHPRSTKG